MLGDVVVNHQETTAMAESSKRVAAARTSACTGLQSQPAHRDDRGVSPLRDSGFQRRLHQVWRGC